MCPVYEDFHGLQAGEMRDAWFSGIRLRSLVLAWLDSASNTNVRCNALFGM